jgi:divalent metal cation (Fe/Co/Zn/Cd) transporter
LSVNEAHALTEEIITALREQFANARVMIHIEPCGHDCDDLCRAGCFVPEEQVAPPGA